MEEKLAKKVRSCWHSVQVKEGDIIIAKGDACEAIYVLHEGEVGMFKECEAQKSPVGEAHPTEDKFESLSLDMHLHTIQSPETQSPHDPVESFRFEDDDEEHHKHAAIHSLHQNIDHKSDHHVQDQLASPKPRECAPEDIFIQYSCKGFLNVNILDSGGVIQMRRRHKRSHKAEHNVQRMVLSHKLSRGDFFGETALVSGSPINVTLCAMRDSTLLILGRESFLDARLQFEQSRFLKVKTLIQDSSIARHLPVSELEFFLSFGKWIVKRTAFLNDCMTKHAG
jgi:CRP-like cAMP-binding protein